ncbi:Protease inhibitor I4, serpin, conserved site-containing protein [Artemisia annua]|uniref:Protease inhibitor I4, serpin, conserved site-containing protein n=1 Tax=Artemisia annua TaxID=35608 RepID=A0A2U1M198_ARTAN|nr:Protease inhibitor I4, serpin, conserved site-containing protein [Artemisia annua]
MKANELSNEVNLWAEKKTSGLFKELLPVGAVSNFMKLMFANAIYFKGVWNEMFDTLDTKDYDFHLLNGSKVQAPFMTTKKNS